ncbi:MAG: hypothetical protein ACK5G7_02760 [Erysipelotrichaceae bacterium]
MKIVINNISHRFPQENRIIYENNEYINNLFSFINEYSEKKKTNIKLLDEDNDIIDKSDISIIRIIDLSLIRQYLSMSAKSVFKEFLLNTMNENDEMFLSTYQAIDMLQDSLSDKGFIRLKKLMFEGVENECGFNKEEISVSSILNIYALSLEQLSETEICIVYLNMMIKIYCDKNIIIDINRLNIDKTFINWINKLKKNIKIFISNDCICNIQIFSESNFVLLMLKNRYDIEIIEVNRNYFDKYLFAFLPIITRNLKYLEEKTVNINKMYNQNDQNILVKFDEHTPEIVFT